MQTARARRWRSWNSTAASISSFRKRARYADVVLAGSLQEEDEGTVTTGEGRCVRLQQSVTPPGDARVDWQIIVELAQRLGFKDYFPYAIAERHFPRTHRSVEGRRRWTTAE